MPRKKKMKKGELAEKSDTGVSEDATEAVSSQESDGFSGSSESDVGASASSEDAESSDSGQAEPEGKRSLRKKAQAGTNQKRSDSIRQFGLL